MYENNTDVFKQNHVAISGTLLLIILCVCVCVYVGQWRIAASLQVEVSCPCRV